MRRRRATPLLSESGVRCVWGRRLIILITGNGFWETRAPPPTRIQMDMPNQNEGDQVDQRSYYARARSFAQGHF